MKNNLLTLNEDLRRKQNELSRLNENLEEVVRDRTDKLRDTIAEMEEVNSNLEESNRQLKDAHNNAKRDMEMAGNVQSSFLPGKVPPSDEWEVAYLFRPREQVSGDFYDFYDINGRLKGVGLFDVSGHGVAAGLITMIARSVMYRTFHRGADNIKFHEIMEEGNDILIKEIGNVDNYISGVMLRLHESMVEYVNAGHPDIIFKSGDTGIAEFFDEKNQLLKGSYLGISTLRGTYTSMTRKIQKGDVIFIYSDCLVESFIRDGNNNVEQYGKDRVLKLCNSAVSGNAQEILNTISSRFFHETASEELTDDLTLIIVKKL